MAGLLTSRDFPSPLGEMRESVKSCAVAAADSPYIFAGPKRRPFDFHNFRRREWGPAIVSAEIVRPARIYDLRSTSSRTRWRAA